VLLSGLFLMDALSKYSESIAIRAAGISIFRMVLPLLLFGLFFSGVVMIFSELVLPKAEEMRHVIYTEKIKKMKVEDKKLRSHIHYIGSDNNLYYIDFFDGYRNTLKTIDITTFDGDAGRIQRKITANSASWSDSNWVFENCHIRSFHPDGRSDVTYFPTTTIEEVDVTPIDFIKSAKKPMAIMGHTIGPPCLMRSNRVGLCVICRSAAPPEKSRVTSSVSPFMYFERFFLSDREGSADRAKS